MDAFTSLENIILICTVGTMLVGYLSQMWKLENTLKVHAELLKESKEERVLVLKSLLAISKRAVETGANGYVTKVVSEIEDFLIEK